jgi:hypothetical protein
MIDKMLVSVIAWGLAIIIAMQFLLAGLPLFRRLEFDALCHQYMMLIDRAGGLTDETAEMLQIDLRTRGFTVDRVSGTRDAPFGGELSLCVEARYPGCRIGGNLMIEEVAISFTYQANLVCRKLKTYDGVP